MLYYEEEDSYYTFTLGEDFSKDFKNKLAVNTTIEIDNYLKDKVNEFIKKNNISIK
jgi:predicted nucleotide-binding protein (sugar kinase/HSP70/actin superfamily)